MAHRLIVEPLPVETPGVLFDMTRLIRSVERPIATGIDRIDLAIGQDLAARFGQRCRFVHQMLGGVAYVPGALARALLDDLDRQWHGDGTARVPRWLTARLLAARAFGAIVPSISDPDETTYIVASHSGVFRRPGLIDRIDPRAQMSWIVYLHDLIPLEHPEFQTPQSVETFRGWLADAVHTRTRFVVNSRDTGTRLCAYGAQMGWNIAEPVLRLPRLERVQDKPPEPRPALSKLFAANRSIFLALGTIEPRKNHRLLLEIWRELIGKLADPPGLLISGRRGWMNQEVFEALDWDETFDGHINEFADLTDAEIAFAMTQSKALLFPSFAEGLGIPVMEAALYGLPVIASDLAALREVAAAGTQFLDPTHQQAWTQAILSASSGEL